MYSHDCLILEKLTKTLVELILNCMRSPTLPALCKEIPTIAIVATKPDDISVAVPSFLLVTCRRTHVRADFD
jgi:hypothetical protein